MQIIRIQCTNVDIRLILRLRKLKNSPTQILAGESRFPLYTGFKAKISSFDINVFNDTKPDCDSAIVQHLLENDQCALNYDIKRFSILAAARSSFHLNLLEAAYIKTRRPALCRQKEFVYIQTLSIIVTFLFGLLLRFFSISLLQNLFFGALYNSSATIS